MSVQQQPKIRLYILPQSLQQGLDNQSSFDHHGINTPSTAWIWDESAVRFIRQHYRVVGSFIGIPQAGNEKHANKKGKSPSCATISQENHSKREEMGDDEDLVDTDDDEIITPVVTLRSSALPLQLLPEEVSFLLELGIVHFCIQNPPHTTLPPSADQWADYSQQREDDFKAYYAAKQEISRIQRHNHLLISPSWKVTKDSDASITEGNESPPLLLPVPEAPLHPVSMPITRSAFPWGKVGESDIPIASLQHAKSLGLWSYPSTPHETQKFKVFCAIHAKGYYLTSGLKFGGDFLAYPDDPTRVHSSFIISVVEGVDYVESMWKVIAHGRLGTCVKKRHAICAWDENTNSLVSSSIKWTGWK